MIRCLLVKNTDGGGPEVEGEEKTNSVFHGLLLLRGRRNLRSARMEEFPRPRVRREGPLGLLLRAGCIFLVRPWVFLALPPRCACLGAVLKGPFFQAETG